jgi:hypothetical protein
VRLWSIHPQYLDTKGLLALWRESLLAQKVLKGETKGYRHHPQLRRFKDVPDPKSALATYMEVVYEDSLARGFGFSKGKIESERKPIRIACTVGQLLYEWEHLKQKLRTRDAIRYEIAAEIPEPEAHPMFDIVAGDVEVWEIRRNHL